MPFLLIFFDCIYLYFATTLMKNFRKDVMEILAQSNPRTGVSPPHWPSIQVEDLESLPNSPPPPAAGAS